MENAKKNLVFHFGVGRQAAFYRIDYVKCGSFHSDSVKKNVFSTLFLNVAAKNFVTLQELLINVILSFDT